MFIDVMSNVADLALVNRRYLVMDKEDVMEVLDVINKHGKWFIDKRIAIGNCGWADYPDRWFIHFNANQNQWWHIVNNLNQKYDMKLDNRPKKVTDILLVKKH